MGTTPSWNTIYETRPNGQHEAIGIKLSDSGKFYPGITHPSEIARKVSTPKPKKTEAKPKKQSKKKKK